MSNDELRGWERPPGTELAKRLAEPRRFLQVLAGPRQVGKTTLVTQVMQRLAVPCRYASADEPTLRDRTWLVAQWEIAREMVRSAPPGGAVLVLDEVQKVGGWPETVKDLWDADTRARLPLRVVLLGSAPLLVERGLTESLAGRFEVLRLPHWSFGEMRTVFGWDHDRFVFHGGYPGAAPLVDDPVRWSAYVRDSLIETTVSRDVLLLSRVDKPALLRRLMALACEQSGRIVSWTKMLGTLTDAGNTTTLAHYLDLLAAAGMVTGFQKYTAGAVRQRGSSPKLQVMNNALLGALCGRPFAEVRADPATWGRFVESAVGAHLANAQALGRCEVFWWRDRNREVDFVVRAGRRVTAIEVKSGARREALSGLDAFRAAFEPDRVLLIGGDGIPVEEFLASDVERWIAT